MEYDITILSIQMESILADEIPIANAESDKRTPGCENMAQAWPFEVPSNTPTESTAAANMQNNPQGMGSETMSSEWPFEMPASQFSFPPGWPSAAPTSSQFPVPDETQFHTRRLEDIEKMHQQLLQQKTRLEQDLAHANAMLSSKQAELGRLQAATAKAAQDQQSLHWQLNQVMLSIHQAQMDKCGTFSAYEQAQATGAWHAQAGQGAWGRAQPWAQQQQQALRDATRRQKESEDKTRMDRAWRAAETYRRKKERGFDRRAGPSDSACCHLVWRALTRGPYICTRCGCRTVENAYDCIGCQVVACAKCRLVLRRGRQ